MISCDASATLRQHVTTDELTRFAQRYAKAWCSQNPESVAAFFAENGSLKVNTELPLLDARRSPKWRAVSCAIYRT